MDRRESRLDQFEIGVEIAQFKGPNRECLLRAELGCGRAEAYVAVPKGIAPEDRIENAGMES